MPTDFLHLIGAGGHARVVLDALLCQGWDSARIEVRDDRLDLAGLKLLGCSISVPVNSGHSLHGWVHVAVGDGRLRERLLEQSGLPPQRWLTVRHSRAVVADSVLIAEGCFVAALAIVGPCCVVDQGVIVNHGAVVDHDCSVGAFCHIGPHATLGGGVKIGHRAFVGAGATVLPGRAIGDDAVIGAGAVVLDDVPAGQTFVGAPARHISERKS